MDAVKHMGEQPIGRLLLRYSLPTIAGFVANALYQFVDRIIVGRGVGTDGMAAVTSAFPLSIAAMALGLLLGTGTGNRIAMLLGQRNAEGAERVLGQGLRLALILGVALAILTWLFTRPLLLACGATPRLLPMAAPFARIGAFGQIFLIALISMGNILRVQGRPMLGLLIMLSSNVLNIALAYVAVFVLRWGGDRNGPCDDHLSSCRLFDRHRDRAEQVERAAYPPRLFEKRPNARTVDPCARRAVRAHAGAGDVRVSGGQSRRGWPGWTTWRRRARRPQHRGDDADLSSARRHAGDDAACRVQQRRGTYGAGTSDLGARTLRDHVDGPLLRGPYRRLSGTPGWAVQQDRSRAHRHGSPRPSLVCRSDLALWRDRNHGPLLLERAPASQRRHSFARPAAVGHSPVRGVAALVRIFRHLRRRSHCGRVVSRDCGDHDGARAGEIAPGYVTVRL